MFHFYLPFNLQSPSAELSLLGHPDFEDGKIVCFFSRVCLPPNVKMRINYIANEDLLDSIKLGLSNWS